MYIENANISCIYNFHIRGQTNTIFVCFSCISKGFILRFIKMKDIRFFDIL